MTSSFSEIISAKKICCAADMRYIDKICYLIIFSFLVVCSCTQDKKILAETVLNDNNDMYDNSCVYDKKIVRFSLYSSDYLSTKTEYFGTSNRYIKWSTDDQIRIFESDLSSSNSSDYNVIPQTDIPKALIEPVENGLTWLSNSDHNFVAVYPADNSRVIDYTDNILTLKAQVYKSLEVEGDSDGNYSIPDEMHNAFMVASKFGISPSDEIVNLIFSPIMTTYEVTITNNNSSDFTAVSGFILSYENSNRYIDNEGNFKFDVKNGNLVPFSSESYVPGKINFAYYFSNGYAGNIDLRSGKTIKFTMFLPPLPDLEDGSNHLTLQVLAGDFSNVSGRVDPSPISSKSKLNVSLLSNPKGSEEWMKYLDDNILASKLSIPGAAYAGMEYRYQSSSTGSSYNYSGSSYAAQEFCVEKLWNMGIRAFDFHSGTDYYANHRRSVSNLITGYTGYTAYNLIDFLSNKLNGSTEFAIVFFRIENGSNNAAVTAFKNLSEYYWNSGCAVAFSPNLTVGDLRGKILMIGLEYGTNGVSDYKFSANIVTSGWPGGGWLQKSYNSIFEGPDNIRSKNASTSTMIAQEYIEASGDLSSKSNLIDSQLKLLKNKYRESDTWSYMTTYSYTEDGFNANAMAGGQGRILGDGNWGITIFSNYAKQYSPTTMGIVMSTFVGVRQFWNYAGAGYWAYGDILPNLLISNNFTQNLLKYDKTSGSFYY